jgi:hypothetical protein
MVEKMNTAPTPLPFGKHKGRPLAEVPASYLSWLLAEVKLSSGLRCAVAAELTRRGPYSPPPLATRNVRYRW